MAKIVTAEARKELVTALRERYRAGSRDQKGRILAEFVATSGYHRKSAIRLLNGDPDMAIHMAVRGRRRVYDDAVRQALIVLWEASDRVCGKRLRALVPILLPALERHGYLKLDLAVRDKLVAISAASMDRLLSEAHAGNPGRKSKNCPPRYPNRWRSARSPTGTSPRPVTWKWTWWPTAALRPQGALPTP